MKIWGILGVIIIILMFLFYAYKQVKNSGVVEANTKVLQEESKKQIRTIKIKKKQERIITNPAIDNNGYRTEWLQFIWREDSTADR